MSLRKNDKVCVLDFLNHQESLKNDNVTFDNKNTKWLNSTQSHWSNSDSQEHSSRKIKKLESSKFRNGRLFVLIFTRIKILKPKKTQNFKSKEGISGEKEHEIDAYG